MTTSIYNEINPAGFDFQILQVQNYLSKLLFLESIFGVSHIQLELLNDSLTQDKYLLPDYGKHGKEKHERWFPQGRKFVGNQGSDIDLTFDDSYTSRVFFIAKDPINTSPAQDPYDWPDGNVEIKQPFSLIFHCNLQKIANILPQITNYEQVKLGVLYALNQTPKIIVNSMSESVENIWKEFSLTPNIKDFAKYPYYALRVECDSYYYAFPVNGRTLEYQPSQLYNPSLSTPTPNTDPGYANTN